MATRWVFLASGWHSPGHRAIANLLESAGHRVVAGRCVVTDDAFHWSDLDEDWAGWTSAQFAEAMGHPRVCAQLESHTRELTRCDTCVLLLPSDRGAHLEAGLCSGLGMDLHVLLPPMLAPRDAHPHDGLRRRPSFGPPEADAESEPFRFEAVDPELMYGLARVHVTLRSLREALARPPEKHGHKGEHP